MKKIFALLVVLVLGGILFAGFKSLKQKIKSDLRLPLQDTLQAPSVIPTVDVKHNPNAINSLFIPYWALGNETISPESYDAAIYFGVVPNSQGLNKEEEGFKALSQFKTQTATFPRRYLVLRMLDNSLNFKVLANESVQTLVIQDFIKTTKENNFDGIILDLEVSALPFDSLVKQINTFQAKLYAQAKTQKLYVGMMVYGDVFYRVRPFEMKSLIKSTDQLYIMAYDFSKARGNPGPNFPLAGKDTYGYDYLSLISDFLAIAPRDKLTVVFGMYGYDWTVDETSKATGLAKSSSLNKIKQTIINSCKYQSCSWERDQLSQEIKAKYFNGENHQVWTEDSESMQAKKSFLKKHGIFSYGFWAYSYF